MLALTFLLLAYQDYTDYRLVIAFAAAMGFFFRPRPTGRRR